MKLFGGFFALFFGIALSLCIAEFVAANLAAVDTPPGLFQPSPTRNFEHRPFFKGRDRLRNPIRINSHGLRDKEYPLEKPPGVYRVFVLGDSVAFGDGIRAEDTFPKKLEALFSAGGRRVEVLNGGVRGYNTYHELQLLKEVGFFYHPDLVLLAYVLNDAEPLSSQRGLIDERWSWFIRIKDFVKRHSYLYALFRRTLELGRRRVTPQQFLETYDDQFSPEHPGWKLSLNSLEEIQRLTSERNIRFSVVVVPRLEGLLPGETYPCEKIQRQVVESARVSGIDTLDALPLLKGQDPERLKVTKGDCFHLNAFGNALLAEALKGHLEPHVSQASS